MVRATALIAFSSVIMMAAAAAPAPDVGWSAYGGDAGGTRYSTAAQITPANVDQLEVAWTFRTGELGQGVKDWSRSAFEATPILYDGTLYLTTSSTDVVAVNAVTGKLRWRHDSRSRDDLHYSDGVSRGVSLWVDSSSPPQAVCHARIFAPTLDGRLLALDAATGKPCVEFGERGAVNLLLDVRSQFKEGDEWRDYLVTSPPAILDDKVIVGSSIGDNRAVLEELGIVRAYDARSGRLAWSWDPIPRDASNPVYKEWSPASIASASAANAWAPLSVDAERRLVFGRWLRPGLRLLAAARRLRGTPLDPFGWSAARRAERALADEYAAAVSHSLDRLDATTHGAAVRLAALPGEVRGFGSVKRAAAERMRAQMREQVERPSTPTQGAPR